MKQSPWSPWFIGLHRRPSNVAPKTWVVDFASTDLVNTTQGPEWIERFSTENDTLFEALKWFNRNRRQAAVEGRWTFRLRNLRSGVVWYL